MVFWNSFVFYILCGCLISESNLCIAHGRNWNNQLEMQDFNTGLVHVETEANTHTGKRAKPGSFDKVRRISIRLSNCLNICSSPFTNVHQLEGSKCSKFYIVAVHTYTHIYLERIEQIKHLKHIWALGER